MTEKYRGYNIEYNPPPIPVSCFDFQFWNEDYDGTPDSGDRRYGTAETLAEAMLEIDRIEHDQ